ncbi:RagB/SusD family nutrient uptake outer membrane protein [Pinibacter soli]|uniref:RagB/SusD family nutrient uptake outer membrane protein n=1 Tax=Pinibacter soli TaxID=3044211 RepID=A0ABT6RDC4_9BACT|nr:RagB/SusD family nutrient uptake outer membrane protein [Pinibacter soli]MDI3320570.1 RagB/SusD family nutrient uptake outer membrane protein [Pinibacter soli]
MKKNILIITIIIATAFTSCKKWLDITPQSQVSEEDLFKTEQGFEEAMNGIYSRCASGDLYGTELTFGFPDVLAQNFSIESAYDKRKYLQTSLYNYKDADFINRKDNAWKGLYNAIGNCNLILENIDSKKNLFTDKGHDLIKGETLGMRAYLHFDALRLFGPSFATGASTKAIPYVTSFTNKVTDLSTVTESIDKMIADLLQAKELLRPVDPIMSASYRVNYPNITDTLKYTEESSTDLFLQNRRHRFNYYAVCAELARVYLYKDDKVNALANAMEIINSKKFPFTDKGDFINSDIKLKDRINYKELIFAFYIPDMVDDLSKLFDQGNESILIKEDGATFLYEVAGVGGTDNRYKQWFASVDAGVRNLALQKYVRNPDAKDDDLTANRHPLMAPALRLSEMYYIAAECTYDANPKAAQGFVDSVRFARNIGVSLVTASKNEFLNELVKEARKEFYGEGQIFYMYKRLNKAIVGLNGGSYGPSSNIFVLPLPNDEIEFGQRN